MADSNHTKKPADTPFKQQRLPAWQPILSPPWVISCFFLVAAIFIPIGALVIVASGEVVEKEVQYDSTERFQQPGVSTPGFRWPPYNMGQDYETLPGRTLVRWVKIDVDQSMDRPVYMYYKLDNFYQNHRRYARSRSDTQLAGDKVGLGDIGDCKPFRYADEDGDGSEELDNVYAPCGLIAWSMFNDTFRVYKALKSGANCSDDAERTANCRVICNTGINQDTPDASPGSQQLCTKDGIAWNSDKDKKYKTPWSGEESYRTAASSGNDKYYHAEAALCRKDGSTTNEVCPPPPRDSSTDPGYKQITEGHLLPNQTDESFMVWMRTASLPTFRKLFRRFSEDDFDGFTPSDGQPVELWIQIFDRFDVHPFQGKKYIILSTTTLIGGKNYFLGTAYVVIGCLCFMLALVFVIKQLTNNRSSAPN